MRKPKREPNLANAESMVRKLIGAKLTNDAEVGVVEDEHKRKIVQTNPRAIFGSVVKVDPETGEPVVHHKTGEPVRLPVYYQRAVRRALRWLNNQNKSGDKIPPRHIQEMLNMMPEAVEVPVD